jgi:hypothetical protein
MKPVLYRCCGLLVLLAVIAVCPPARADGTSFEDALAGLSQSTGEGVSHAAEAISATGDARALRVLQALMDGDVLVCDGSKRVLLHAKDGSFVDAVSGSRSQADGCKEADIDNEVRRVLDPLITRLELRAPEASVRAAAVDEIAKSASEDDANA